MLPSELEFLSGACGPPLLGLFLRPDWMQPCLLYFFVLYAGACSPEVTATSISRSSFMSPPRGLGLSANVMTTRALKKLTNNVEDSTATEADLNCKAFMKKYGVNSNKTAKKMTLAEE